MTTIIRPACATTRYNIRGGSLVRIVFNNKDEVVGTVVVNPTAPGSGREDSIQLINSTHLRDKFFLRDVQHFFHNEIREVTVLKSNEAEVKRIETSMTTFVVGNPEQLDRFIEALVGVSEVSVSLISDNGGRFGKVSWLMLCIMDNLIPVDILELESYGDKFAWEKFRAPLFENSNILKIIHDSRAVADYLYHSCRVTLNNVFDTQACDLLIKRRNQALKEIEIKGRIPGQKPFKAVKLTECLFQYLSDVIPETELALMGNYEKDLKRDGPMMASATTEKNGRKYAALSVKYLSQLKERMARYMKLKEIKCFDTYIKFGIEGSMADAKYHIVNPELVHSEMLQLLGALPPLVKLNGTDEL